MRRWEIENRPAGDPAGVAREASDGVDHFQDGHDIVFDRHAAEDRCFLRQIADAAARALEHRLVGDFVAVEVDGAGIGLDQAGDDVEAGGLAGAVGAQQADRLAPLHADGNIPQHRLLLVLLAQVIGAQALDHGGVDGCRR